MQISAYNLRVVSLGLFILIAGGCSTSAPQAPVHAAIQDTPPEPTKEQLHDDSLRDVAAAPPGPNEAADDLRLPGNQTYFAFARDVKEALDRDFGESSKFGSFRSSRGRDTIIARGGGVYVRLAGDNFNIHIGYTPTTENGGENSGRSYGVGPLRGGVPDDLSYPALFRMMQNYAARNDLSDFYRAFFKIIIFSDARAMLQLNPSGQQLMSDVISIYNAELNRNLMSGLTRFDWQKHLGDVTMLAAFHAETDLAWAADEGRLVTGDLDVFIGHGTQGSGVGGRGGIERRKFQRKLTSALRKTSPAVARLEAIIGPQTDIFHGLMEALNRNSVQNGDGIVEAAVAMLSDLRKNGQTIAGNPVLK